MKLIKPSHPSHLIVCRTVTRSALAPQPLAITFARVHYHLLNGVSWARGVLIPTRVSSTRRCEVNQSIQIQLSPSAIMRTVNATMCVCSVNIRVSKVVDHHFIITGSQWGVDRSYQHSEGQSTHDPITSLPSKPCGSACAVWKLGVIKSPSFVTLCLVHGGFSCHSHCFVGVAAVDCFYVGLFLRWTAFMFTTYFYVGSFRIFRILSIRRLVV